MRYIPFKFLHHHIIQRLNFKVPIYLYVTFFLCTQKRGFNKSESWNLISIIIIAGCACNRNRRRKSWKKLVLSLHYDMKLLSIMMMMMMMLEKNLFFSGPFDAAKENSIKLECEFIWGTLMKLNVFETGLI